jgi:hypothetical protein
MKAKYLFILLSVLFIIPMNAAPTKGKKAHFRYKDRHARTQTRAPFEFDLSVREVNGILALNFQSSLQDAEITVTDKEGTTVIYEPQTFIYEGMILYIYTPNAYPYTVEITSPTLDITGEIALEEN